MDIIQTAEKNGKTKDDAEKSFFSSAKSELKKMFMEDKLYKSKAIKALADFCGMNRDDAEKQVAEWTFEIDHGYEYGERMERYYTAVVTNDQDTADDLYDYLIAEKVSEGYLKHEAEDAVASSFATQVGKAYMDGEITRYQAIELLKDNTNKGEKDVKKWDFELDYGFSWGERVRKYRLGKISKTDLMSAVMDIEGETRSGAEEYIRFLNLEMANEDFDITASDASSYFKHAEPAGISVTVYLDYKDKASQCEGDKDKNGKTIRGSKKDKVLAVINSMPISKEQKDALYLAEGYDKDTIKKAPWHKK